MSPNPPPSIPLLYPSALSPAVLELHHRRAEHQTVERRRGRLGRREKDNYGELHVYFVPRLAREAVGLVSLRGSAASRRWCAETARRAARAGAARRLRGLEMCSAPLCDSQYRRSNEAREGLVSQPEAVFPNRRLMNALGSLRVVALRAAAPAPLLGFGTKWAGQRVATQRKNA